MAMTLPRWSMRLPVSVSISTGILPMRFGAVPEIFGLTLRSDAHPPAPPIQFQ
ncbi:MAG: hypothetical protein ACREO8_03135 [Luteimonas sp.]